MQLQVVRHSHNDVVAAAKRKVVLHNDVAQLAQRVPVGTAALDSFEGPRDDVRARGGDDGRLAALDVGVEAGGCEGDFRVHVGDVVGLELQASWDRLGFLGEGAIKAAASERSRRIRLVSAHEIQTVLPAHAYSPLSLVSAVADQGVDQEQIRLARRNHVAPVCRDVHAEDRVTKRGQSRLCVLADLIKQAQLALG